MREAFRVVEPSGKEYRLFEDGRIEGFAEGAIVINRVPVIVAAAAETEAKTVELRPGN